MTVAGEVMLGRGIYDPTDAARLVRAHPETLARWTTGPRALVEPSFGQLFDFEDLVSLLAVAELRRRNVAIAEIRRGIEMLAGELDVARPLAHLRAREIIATAGKAFLANVGDWVDAGKGGQGVFWPMIEPVLKPLEFGPSGMANLWRPVANVAADPTIQAGAPCVEGTRVPTATLRGLIAAGDTVEDVSFDLELDIAQIEAALRFENAIAGPRAGQSVLA